MKNILKHINVCKYIYIYIYVIYILYIYMCIYANVSTTGKRIKEDGGKLKETY